MNERKHETKEGENAEKETTEEKKIEMMHGRIRKMYERKWATRETGAERTKARQGRKSEEEDAQKKGPRSERCDARVKKRGRR